MLVTLAQVALGTQVRGTVDDALDAGVGRGAALATVGLFDSAHRILALAVMSVALVTLLVLWSKHPRERMWRSGRTRWWRSAACRSCLAYVYAYVALAPPFQVLHLTVASLLMGASDGAAAGRVGWE